MSGLVCLIGLGFLVGAYLFSRLGLIAGCFAILGLVFIFLAIGIASTFGI